MNPRNAIALAHDLVACAAAWIGAFLLRFNFDIPEPWWSIMWRDLAPVMLAQGVVMWRLRLYQGLWRYASVPDLRRIVLAALLGVVVITTISILRDARELPRTVLVLYPILLTLLMGASRFAYRLWKEGRVVASKHGDAKRVVILGAGELGATLARSLRAAPDVLVVGFLDDDAGKIGRDVAGLTVLGAIDDLAELRSQLGIEQAIIAMTGAPTAERRRAFQRAADAGVPAFAVPAFGDLAAGRVRVSELHRVQLEDLLGREQVSLDVAKLTEFFGGGTVLVTGAGGSIGSELCRQIAIYSPTLLVLVDSSEFALYRIESEFQARFPATRVIALIGDARDALRMRSIFDTHRPRVVFHAAAYKHVPLMEDVNAWEAARNNILGTYHVARAAIGAGTRTFVLISTDKAVNPTNVMGATKRVSELVVQALQKTSDMRFVTVRFGNVLGSAGSVVPKFRAQIAAGGPVTVTHPDVTRYFMLIPEAAQLVLQAGLMGRGGEIFVLDMGEPIRIVDLARDMIRLSGLAPDDIPIEFTGLRPGEKLYEEVLAGDETSLPTPHPKVRVARATAAPDERWLDDVLAWLDGGAQRGPDEVRARLMAWLPEYRPSGESGAAPIASAAGRVQAAP